MEYWVDTLHETKNAKMDILWKYAMDLYLT
jgi:hypothetical protein